MSAKLRRFRGLIESKGPLDCYLCTLNINNQIMLRTLLAFAAIFMAFTMVAQPCGTPQAPLLERTDANKKAMIEVQRGALKYIPMTFHLVANDAGSGRVTEESILYQVASINEQYSDQEAIFYIDRFNYFDDDAVYDSPRSNAANTQMRLRKDNNSINVFVVNNIESTGPGQTLAYFDPQEDWLVSRKGQINGASSTLAHEVGHFFSLAHPFSGWDCNPFNIPPYTNPVAVTFTIPCDGGGGSSVIELHDRSNCNTAGDHICDTPEDYNLGLFWQNNCAENNSVKDINGDVIKPMTNNFMSYYTNCATYQFSNTQKNLINTDFFTFQRSYIRTGNVPNTTPVTDPVSYISPINGNNAGGTTNILLDWEDTPGANKYLVIYDRFMSFTFAPKKFIVTGSEFLITDQLGEDVTYYWKVWPYNESETGADYSATQNFKASLGTAVNEIREITSFTLSPNPVRTLGTVRLAISATKPFAGTIEVTNTTGQRLSSQKINITSGVSQHEIETTDLSAGLYFIILHSEKGRLVERMFIID